MLDSKVPGIVKGKPLYTLKEQKIRRVHVMKHRSHRGEYEKSCAKPQIWANIPTKTPKVYIKNGPKTLWKRRWCSRSTGIRDRCDTVHFGSIAENHQASRQSNIYSVNSVYASALLTLVISSTFIHLTTIDRR